MARKKWYILVFFHKRINPLWLFALPFWQFPWLILSALAKFSWSKEKFQKCRVCKYKQQEGVYKQQEVKENPVIGSVEGKKVWVQDFSSLAGICKGWRCQEFPQLWENFRRSSLQQEAQKVGTHSPLDSLVWSKENPEPGAAGPVQKKIPMPGSAQVQVDEAWSNLV